MEHDHLIAMLNRLKLTAIRDQLDSLIDEAGRRELTIREALSLFGEREIARKDERRIEMAIGLPHFPFVRGLDGFDFAAQPSIDKKQIREIAAGRFIANAEVVLLLGPPRVGKTHLAVACPPRPSPFLSRVGIRDFTFEACSGFTHVTACRIAQPPEAAFVAKLQPSRLPRQAACQLPHQTNYYLGGTLLHW